VGERLLFSIFEADARLEGVDPADLAANHVVRVRQALEQYRLDRTRPALARAAAGALLAALGAVVAARLLGALFTRLSAAAEARYQRRARNFGIQSFEILRAEQMWGLLAAGLVLARGLALFATVTIALHFALARFPWTRGLAHELGDWATRPLALLFASLATTLPDLLFLSLLYLGTRYALGMIRLFFDAIGRGSVRFEGFDAEWADPTYKLVRLGAIGLALVVAYPYIPGSESPAFKGLSLFLGILASLGSSSFIANTIAGYSMTYRRAFRVGERVRIGEVVGDVTAVRLQVTHVRTPKNEEVVIPNSVILGASVVNYSRLAAEHGLILHTTVGIGYETPWRQVEAMLLKAAMRTPGLLQAPAPFVQQVALGDFAITYELNVPCNQPHRMNALYSELHRNILDVFNEYGVPIMTPAYEADPAQPKLVRQEDWYLAPASPPATPIS
jgi:small-conductance mechanosensitive channel